MKLLIFKDNRDNARQQHVKTDQMYFQMKFNLMLFGKILFGDVIETLQGFPHQNWTATH